MIRVRCVDGVVRHEPFATLAEAQEWAWWGHVCVATHHYEYIDDRQAVTA